MKKFFFVGFFLLFLSPIALAQTSEPLNIPKNYQLWDVSPYIFSLQQFLNGNGYIVSLSAGGSPGHETNTFGTHTYRALIDFQRDHGISGTGFLGPLSRAEIARVSSFALAAPVVPIVPTTTPPVISAASSSPVVSTTTSVNVRTQAPGVIVPASVNGYTSGYGGGSAPLPVITLTGNNPYIVAQNSTFTDPGASVFDNVDSSVGLVVTGTVDTSTLGSYVLTYNATDVHGNRAQTVTRTVNVTDQTAPNISSITNSIIGLSTTTLTWTTNESSDSQIEYGTTTSYGSLSALNASLITSHSVVLNTLLGSTTYHYRVRTTDSAGNLALSSDQTVMTNTPSLVYATSSTLLTSAVKVYVSGNYLYETAIGGRLNIFDITNPASPTLVKSYLDSTNMTGADAVVVKGNYAFVTCESGASLTVVNVTDPANPSTVIRFRGPTPGTSLAGASNLLIVGNTAYVSTLSRHSLAMIDISTPTLPVWLSEIRGPSPGTSLNTARDVVVSGNTAYVTAEGNNSVGVIDVTDPSNPVWIKSLTDTGLHEVRGALVNGNYLYTTSSCNSPAGCKGDFMIYDISSPTNPVLLSQLNPTGSFNSATSLSGARGIAIVGTVAFVTSEGGKNLNAIDITDPTNPSFIYQTRGVNPGVTLNGAMGIQIVGSNAYIALFGGNGLTIMNVGL